MKPNSSFSDKKLSEYKEERKAREFKREDGLTADDFKVGDIIAWETPTGIAGGKIVQSSTGEKLIFTQPGRALLLRDIISSPSLHKLV